MRLRLGSSDVCVVRWLKEPQATMLVGGVVAEGGRWMRYLITPICRLMSIGWLEELAEQGGKVDYVACALIFDPDRPAGGPRDVMDRRVYQVTDKADLRSFAEPSAVIATRHEAPTRPRSAGLNRRP